MTTDITPADLQNMTPEQLAALATSIQQEQAAASQIDTLLGAAEQPASPNVPASSGEAVTPLPSVVSTVQTTTGVVSSQQEAPINPVAAAVLNGINVGENVMEAVQPAVAAINPEAGIAIETGVLIVNALEAIAGFLGLLPEGPASLGIKGQIAVIKGLVQ